MRRIAIALLLAGSCLSAPVLAQDSSPQTRATEKAIDTNVSQALDHAQAGKTGQAAQTQGSHKKKRAQKQAAQAVPGSTATGTAATPTKPQ